MAANIPDLGAVAHLGGQFQHNVFDTIQKKAHEKGKKTAQAQVKQAQAAQSARNAYAQSAAQAVKQGRQQFAKNQQAQQKQAQQAAKAHAQGVKSGRVAPAPGAPPRTFAMGSSPQQKAQAKQAAAGAKTMQQQRNFAHGEALKFQAAQFKVKQQQMNYAHGQAIQHQKQMNKQASKGGPVNTATAPKAPSLTPSFSSAPTTHTPVKAVAIPQTTFSSQLAPQKPVAKPQGTATASFSSGPTPAKPAPKPVPQMGVTGQQFSDVSPKANDPYPTHVHPAGSSSATLPKLTASQPKPNEFTVGSRNAKPGGIAARGSQLEAWAIGRQAEIRKQRGSDNTQLRLGD